MYRVCFEDSEQPVKISSDEVLLNAENLKYIEFLHTQSSPTEWWRAVILAQKLHQPTQQILDTHGISMDFIDFIDSTLEQPLYEAFAAQLQKRRVIIDIQIQALKIEAVRLDRLFKSRKRKRDDR